MSIEPFLAEIGERTDVRLDALLPSASEAPKELHEAMRYACLGQGKRLRPALVLASAQAAGQPGPPALDAGCAVEMIHAFSLVHDDLPAIDDDDLRRGQPSCHIVFGEAIAILAGDALFAQAFQTIGGLDATPEQIMRSLQSLAAAVGSAGVVGGEVADVLAEGRPADGATVEFIHSRKTGALMGSACEIGAILGGGSPEVVKALRRYGEQLGLAFQIADDLLNELSSVEAVGKSIGSDRAKQKATYPAVFGIAGAQERADSAYREAISAIESVPLAPAPLVDLAEFAAKRTR